MHAAHTVSFIPLSDNFRRRAVPLVCVLRIDPVPSSPARNSNNLSQLSLDLVLCAASQQHAGGSWECYAQVTRSAGRINEPLYDDKIVWSGAVVDGSAGHPTDAREKLDDKTRTEGQNKDILWLLFISILIETFPFALCRVRWGKSRMAPLLSVAGKKMETK